MNQTAYNRTIVIVAFLVLVGWLAFMKTPDLAQIISAAALPLGVYVGIKGKNSNEDGK